MLEKSLFGEKGCPRVFILFFLKEGDPKIPMAFFLIFFFLKIILQKYLFWKKKNFGENVDLKKKKCFMGFSFKEKGLDLKIPWFLFWW